MSSFDLFCLWCSLLCVGNGVISWANGSRWLAGMAVAAGIFLAMATMLTFARP